MINASRPRITPRVTIAPITPATALEIPPEDESVEEVAVLDGLGVVASAAEQDEPVLPHIWHHWLWLVTANFCDDETKSDHDKSWLGWLKRG